MNLPVIRGIIDRRILVNYGVEADDSWNSHRSVSDVNRLRQLGIADLRQM